MLVSSTLAIFGVVLLVLILVGTWLFKPKESTKNTSSSFDSGSDASVVTGKMGHDSGSSDSSCASTSDSGSGDGGSSH